MVAEKRQVSGGLAGTSKPMASLPAHSAANALLRSRLAGYASSPTTSAPACFALAL